MVINTNHGMILQVMGMQYIYTSHRWNWYQTQPFVKLGSEADR